MADLHWTTRFLRVLAAALAIGLAAWYGPFLSALGWHIFHPFDEVKYHGLRVPVPWPWTTDAGTEGADGLILVEGVSLKKMPFAIGDHAPAQTIFVTAISADPGTSAEQQAEHWFRAFQVTHPGAVFSSQTPVTLPAGSSCMSARRERRELVWTCISVSGGWVASFEGEAAGEPAFFLVVRRLGSGREAAAVMEGFWRDRRLRRGGESPAARRTPAMG